MFDLEFDLELRGFVPESALSQLHLANQPRPDGEEAPLSSNSAVLLPDGVRCPGFGLSRVPLFVVTRRARGAVFVFAIRHPDENQHRGAVLGSSHVEALALRQGGPSRCRVGHGCVVSRVADCHVIRADAMAILIVLCSGGRDPYARWPMGKTMHGAVGIPAHNDQAAFAEGGTQFLLLLLHFLPFVNVPLVKHGLSWAKVYQLSHKWRERRE